MEYFWHNQANPLGYSLLSSLLLRALPTLEPLAVVRSLSLMGGVLLLVSVAELLRYLPDMTRPSDGWILMVMAFHPMVWLYTNNATADILPTGLMLASIVCCCRAHTQKRWHLLGIALFCLACIVKFNCILMGTGFIYILLRWAHGDRQQRLKHIGWLLAYAILSLATMAVYFKWIHLEYGIVLLPEKFKTIHTFNTPIMQQITTLLLYLDFLVLFSGPLGLILLVSFFRKSRKSPVRHFVVFLGITCLATVFSLTVQFFGEMNFGGLEALLPPKILLLAHTIGIVMVFLLIQFCAESFGDKRQRYFLWMILTVFIPYLLVSSMTRPSQRYLILILPLFLVWLAYAAGQFRPLLSRVLIMASFVTFISLSILGILFLNSQANAADRMGRWIVDHDLELQTDPGQLVSHIGYLFPLRASANPSYRLESWSRNTSAVNLAPIHEELVQVGPLIVKRFVLLQMQVTNHNNCIKSGLLNGQIK